MIDLNEYVHCFECLLFVNLHSRRGHIFLGKQLHISSSSFLSFFFFFPFPFLLFYCDWNGQACFHIPCLFCLKNNFIDHCFQLFYMDSPPCSKENIFFSPMNPILLWVPETTHKVDNNTIQLPSVCTRILAFINANNTQWCLGHDLVTIAVYYYLHDDFSVFSLCFFTWFPCLCWNTC